MYVYLDTNILVSIENSDYSLSHIKSFLPNKEPIFVYSPAHIFEVAEFEGNEKISKEDLLSKRFDTLRKITSNNFIYFDSNENEVMHQFLDPELEYTGISDVPIAVDSMKFFTSILSKESKQNIRDHLGINITKQNNYGPKEIVEHLTKKIEIFQVNTTLSEFVELAMSFCPDTIKFGIYHRLSAYFEILDILGYWKDKETSSSNYARFWDASHAFYGSRCHYFVCDDKRTRIKTKVVYDIFGIRTKVISSKCNIN